MKNKLLTLLVIHVIIVISVNILSFKSLSSSPKIEKLNPIGEWYINVLKTKNIVEPFRSLIGFYSNMTGTNRGYEYFSPNVSPGAVRLKFIGENDKELQLLETSESKVKMVIATVYYFKKFGNDKAKTAITKSICRKLFENNTSLNTIKVYLSIQSVFSISNTKANKQMTKQEILVSTVKRNRNE